MRKNISSGTQPKRKTDCLEQQKGISARKSKPADLFFIQVVVSWGKRLIFVPIPNHLLSSVPRNTLLLVTSVCRSLASPSCSSLTLGRVTLGPGAAAAGFMRGAECQAVGHRLFATWRLACEVHS